MDHRDLIASLSDQQRRELTAKSDRKGLVALGVHFAAIFFVGAMIWNRVPAWQLLLVVQGILIIFLFTLLHEAIHRTPFKTSWLNDCVAHVCGFLVGLQAEWFRYFHFAHHRHTQDPENDPELATIKPETVLEYCWHVSGISIWWSFIKTLLSHAITGCDDKYVPASGRAKVVREARIYLGVYFSVGMVSWWVSSYELLMLWVIPIILGQPFLRLYLLAEHGRCPMVSNMLQNTRTTFTNALVRRLAWNMPYHIEHHSYPTVPFHQLPKFHAIARTHLKETENGYIRFNQRYVATLNQVEEN